MNTIFVPIPLQSVQSRVEVFEEIFLVFLGLGTLVGIIVVAYTLYNAYKYRDDPDDERVDGDYPTLGELPTGGGSGKKLFVSFGLSAIIVISLVVWTYSMLLYVEAGPNDGNPGDDALEVDVVGEAFTWHFDYQTDDGETVRSSGEMVLPENTTVWVTTTSVDVWHTFGISDQRVKADAIPGEYDETWFHTDELAEGENEHTALVECFELCGPGHSAMEADLRVVPQDEFDDWLADLQEENGEDGGDENASDGGDD